MNPAPIRYPGVLDGRPAAYVRYWRWLNTVTKRRIRHDVLRRHRLRGWV